MRRVLKKLRVMSLLRRAQPAPPPDEDLLIVLAESLAEATGHPAASRRRS